VGECSFCGKRDRPASVFAGIASRVHRICTTCLGVCLDITSEYEKREERSAVAAELARLEPKIDVDPRIIEMLKSGDVDGLVSLLRDLGYGDVLPDDARILIHVWRGHLRYSDVAPDDVRLMDVETGHCSCGIPSGRRRPAAADACSFCDSPRSEVAELVEAPGVAICDRCVDDASADVLGALPKT
jgi:hypothetical protein